MAEQTGMLIGNIKISTGDLQLDLQQPGQGVLHEQLKTLLSAVIATHHLPHEEIPTYGTLQNYDQPLAMAIANYKRYQRAADNAADNAQVTGPQLLAQDIGWPLSASGRYPRGHWQVRLHHTDRLLSLHAINAQLYWLSRHPL